MKNAVIILLFASLSSATFAQSSNVYASKRAEIETQKVAYITTKMNLTPEEAQQFWPLYNAYQDELNKQRKQGKQIENKLQDSADALTDAELDKLMKERFAQERAKIDLDEKYYEKYKTVLPASKIAEFYQAEHSFRRELLDRLRERPQGARPQK